MEDPVPWKWWWKRFYWRCRLRIVAADVIAIEGEGVVVDKDPIVVSYHHDNER